MTFPSNQNLYGIGIGSSNGSGPNNVHFDVRAPTSTDVNFAVGTRWIFINNAEYVLVGQSSAGGVLISDWTLLGTTGGALNTITTQDSTVLIPVAGNINLVGTSPISTTGSGNTGTVALTGTVPVANGGTGLTAVTIHDLMIGNGTSPLTLLAPSATSGVPLISQGASSNPAYGTAVVAGGGTGATTLTAHGVLIGEGTGPVVATAAGTSGQILQSGGASADPAYTNATYPSTATAGSLIAATATNVIGQIIDVAVGQLLASGGVGVIPAYTNSPSVSGSITAGTTLTATLGNITATAGNFVSSTLGDGIMLNSGTTSGTTTATLNGRVGQITITTPSIAGGAVFTFTITNSSVTASTTQVGYWLTGGTTGSALTIQSVTNSSNSSVVVINNGTGATTNSASLVLTFLVLN